MIERLLAFVLIVLLSPLLTVLSLVIIVIDGWPFWYLQKRVGYREKIFVMWKFRTMVLNADDLKNNIVKQNEVDGPVFKIRNDPRFTKTGKFFSHTGIDELLQLFNILFADMSFVGPRPLPVGESLLIPKNYRNRFEVLPGIISPWIFSGYHSLGFEKWMKSDVDYVKNKNYINDSKLLFKAVISIVRMLTTEIIDTLTRCKINV